MIDIDAVRADTPGCLTRIHFNNAGSSMSPIPVVDAVKAHIDLEAEMGGYEAAAHQAEADAGFYRAAGQMLGCRPDEVAFTVSASDAWWRAFMSIPLEPGDRIITGHSEYVANALGLLQATERGIEVVLVPNDEAGQIDLDALAGELAHGAAVVALTHVPTSSGLVNPAAEVGALAKAAGAWYLLDACQSAGQLPLDVDEINCDFLSVTGRKFLRGPRGSGFLYARSDRLGELRPAPFLDGRSADWTSPWEYRMQPGAQRFELFEVSYAAKFGLGVAIDYALARGLENIAERVGLLAGRLRTGLSAINGITVRDPGREKCGIVTFTVDGQSAEAVKSQLRTKGVNVSFSGANAAQFDLGLRGVPAVVRASVHYFNTEAEVDRVLELLS
jgi:cysteine desulfurase/selenocysteine lyase